MTSDQPQAEKIPAVAAAIPKDKPVPVSEKISRPTSVESAAAADQPATAPKLTPEEQMERFAKELKENDWGHQPC